MANISLADIANSEETPITEETVLNIGNEQENDTPDSSPEETNSEEETPSHQGEEETPAVESNTDDENTIPFHKHPAWLERKQQWDEKMAQKDREIQELREAVGRVAEAPTPQSDVVIPEWFKGIYGDDQNAWNSYQADRVSERERIKQELLAEQTAQLRAKEEQVRRWEDYQNTSINRLRDEGKDFDRNELMDVMYKFRPTDEQGNFDFSKGYEILSSIKAAKHNPEKSKARKEIVDMTPSKPSLDTKKDYATAEDFRGKSLYDIVRG